MHRAPSILSSATLFALSSLALSFAAGGDGDRYDPLEFAKARGVPKDTNWEATVPPACYTKTDGTSNPCWV